MAAALLQYMPLERAVCQWPSHTYLQNPSKAQGIVDLPTGACNIPEINRQDTARQDFKARNILPQCSRFLSSSIVYAMYDGWHFRGASGTIHLQGCLLCSSYHSLKMFQVYTSVTQVFPGSFCEATDNPCVRRSFRGTSATAVSSSTKVL